MARVRALSADGDYTFGQSEANFLVDSPAFVAQSIQTRLGLQQGEWFLDRTDGTPYSTAILGAHTKPFYDIAIQERVLRTPGVERIIAYNSNLDPVNRKLTVTGRVLTIYGETTFQGAF